MNPGTTAELDSLRARIGLLLPSGNLSTEPDFYRISPPGVTIHATRMYIMEATPEGLQRMTAEIDGAARLIGTTEADVVAYGCTTGSLWEGPGYDRELAERITRASGIPAITTSTAVMDALRVLGIRSVAVGTPYIDELNARLKRFLEDAGLSVVSLQGLQIRKNIDLAQPPSVVRRLAHEVDRPDADAVLLSCTNLRAVEVADVLEQELGKPVITSNQATVWAALRAAGVRDQISGYGRLLTH